VATALAATAQQLQQLLYTPFALSPLLALSSHHCTPDSIDQEIGDYSA